MKKLLFLTTLYVAFSATAWSQEIQQVKQDGKIVVIDYILQKDANSVNLYVSQDGGKTFKGPLKEVSGDLKDVASGNRQIRWDVIKELGGLKGDVQFKVSVKLKKYYPKETFILANAAYSFAPQLSFGLTFGQVKKFGYYVSVMTGTGFKMKGDFECDENGYVGKTMPFYSGKTSTTRLALTAGGVAHVANPLYLYLGVGYGFRGVFWETTDEQWAKNKDLSVTGVNAELGLMGNIKGFVISAGVSTVNFKYVEAKIGLGWSFKKMKN